MPGPSHAPSHLLLATPPQDRYCCPHFTARNLRLREVSSTLERELDGGTARETEQERGDRGEDGRKTYMIWEQNHSPPYPAQLPALTLGVSSQRSHQPGQSLPWQVRGAQSIAAQPLPGGHSLSEKRTWSPLLVRGSKQSKTQPGDPTCTAGWTLHTCEDLYGLIDLRVE